MMMMIMMMVMMKSAAGFAPGLKLALPRTCGNITFYKHKADKHPKAKNAHNVKYA